MAAKPENISKFPLLPNTQAILSPKTMFLTTFQLVLSLLHGNVSFQAHNLTLKLLSILSLLLSPVFLFFWLFFLSPLFSFVPFLSPHFSPCLAGFQSLNPHTVQNLLHRISAAPTAPPLFSNLSFLPCSVPVPCDLFDYAFKWCLVR